MQSHRGLGTLVTMSAPRNAARGPGLGEAERVRLQDYTTSRGRLQIWQQPMRRIYSTRVAGHLSVELARRIIEYVDPMFENGRVLGFHDWFEMTGYDSASRNELTQWSLRRADLAQINIGTRTKLVSMGVTVAGMVLGERVLRRFASEAELEAAYQAAVRTQA